MDYLTKATKHLLDNTEEISAKYKHVVIVGGGDTGNDCVGTSIRQGCASVVQIEMMPKAPDERLQKRLPSLKRILAFTKQQLRNVF